MARLRAAGAVILAKTSTHEFALGVTNPQSRNPHDPSRIPGGSSGGSAIAVATGMGLASLGTDTRASIRVPAALSGTVGFKPTFGTVPTDGVVTLSWTMDHVAPMAASVADAALVLDALRGADAPDLALAVRRPVGGLRVGLPGAAWEGAEPDVVAAVDEAIASLAAAGVELSPCPGLHDEPPRRRQRRGPGDQPVRGRRLAPHAGHRPDPLLARGGRATRRGARGHARSTTSTPNGCEAS